MNEKEHLTAKRESSERTSVLANERTYAAWIRTGLTAMATGLGAAAFLEGVIPVYVVNVIAFILLTLSGLCFYLAAWRYQHVGVRLVSTHVSGAPITLMCLLSGILIFSSLLALIGLWI